MSETNPYRSPNQISVDHNVESSVEPISFLAAISQCSILFGGLGLAGVYFVDRHDLADWLRLAIGAVSLVTVGLGIYGLRQSKRK